MLDTVNRGFHPSAVVGQLVEKYGVSERCLWSDWERREKWVPVLLGLEKFAGFAESFEEKLNAVQKAAWSIYVHAELYTSQTKIPFYILTSNPQINWKISRFGHASKGQGDTRINNEIRGSLSRKRITVSLQYTRKPSNIIP